MTDRKLIKNATIINESEKFQGDVVIENEFIYEVVRYPEKPETDNFSSIIDATGKILLPGIIDDQVHFRDPGLTHKGDIESESKAAVAGGITSYFEMPNTIPQTTAQKLLEEKFKRAAEKSMANFSFYLGATNNNIEEILKTDLKTVCGIKIFIG